MNQKAAQNGAKPAVGPEGLTLEARVTAFNAALAELLKKHKLQLGAEVVYSPAGISAKPVAIDARTDNGNGNATAQA
jgi:hypothetical protein